VHQSYLKDKNMFMVILNLTRTEPAYGIFILWFRPKKQQFLVALPTP